MHVVVTSGVQVQNCRSQQGSQFLSVHLKSQRCIFPFRRSLTYMAQGEVYEEEGVSILDVIPQIS
jgi:hypothetical protein